MIKVVSCCVCGSKVALANAVAVGYTTAGWPVQLPMTLYACRVGPCRAEDAKTQAARQRPEPTQRVLAGVR